MISFGELQRVFSNKLDERLWRQADKLFPVRITRSWFSRMESIDDPLALQVLPQSCEIDDTADYSLDPVGEVSKMPVPFVVQKHPDRALLLVSRKCHVYCRFCFRRNLDDGQEPTDQELKAAIEYIVNAGVEEVILSGGDPLFLSNKRLLPILQYLSTRIPVIRIHTRAVVTTPHRVDDDLVAGLSKIPNVWVVIHCNHRNELNDEVRSVLAKLRSGGIPLLNQSVLLANVNDDPDTLADLSRTLVRIGVFPYYLHHTDPAQGTSDFRVSLERGLQIHRRLSQMVSGIALPRYVIDPSDGSGKKDVIAYTPVQENK